MTEAADSWARQHIPPFKPWEDDSVEAMDFLAGMNKAVIRSCGVLYCGSKSPLALIWRSTQLSTRFNHTLSHLLGKLSSMVC